MCTKRGQWGRPSYFHSDVFNLYRKYNEGNYWAGGVLSKRAMNSFDKEFAAAEANNGTD
jgi:hypothetical protein